MESTRKIIISQDQTWAGEGHWSDERKVIEDCPAVLPEGAYEAIERDIKTSGDVRGDLEFGGHDYHWELIGAVPFQLTPEDARLLGKLCTCDDAGRHFTEVYPDDFLDRMERADYIEICRPIHQPGIPYGPKYWSVEVTEDGQEAGEAMDWGE